MLIYWDCYFLAKWGKSLDIHAMCSPEAFDRLFLAMGKSKRLIPASNSVLGYSKPFLMRACCFFKLNVKKKRCRNMKPSCPWSTGIVSSPWPCPHSWKQGVSNRCAIPTVRANSLTVLLCFFLSPNYSGGDTRVERLSLELSEHIHPKWSCVAFRIRRAGRFNLRPGGLTPMCLIDHESGDDLLTWGRYRSSLFA